jgi:hypothetical protein
MASQQPFMNNYPIRQQQQQQLQQQQNQQHHLPPPPQHHPPSSTVIDDDAIAAADKEMEERANRAKELLSQRYDSIRKHQVSNVLSSAIRSECFHKAHAICPHLG